MHDRDGYRDAFIAAAGWSGAATTVISGDASNRRYLRLRRADGAQAVLMDAPRDRGEDVGPFRHIAGHLAGLGLSAPRILAADESQGFLLLEDLGDDLFAPLIEHRPELENVLYGAATDLLIHLHRHPPPPGLGSYDPALMTELSALAFDWYATGAGASASAARETFSHGFRNCLAACTAPAGVLALRDYHAENLLWLPDRAGIGRVGLLDFQDALRGHPAYDLVSLLQDARRDVPRDLERAMIDRYVDASGTDRAAFDAAYHCLGVQRNLRIIGVFARLCLRDGKPRYLDLVPRVWEHLLRDLEHPALGGVAETILGAMPDPTPEILERLSGQCVTNPTA